MLNKPVANPLELSALQQAIINNFQKDFPLCEQPYQEVAQLLDSTEALVLSAIEDLNNQGVLSRVGPVFDHKKAGASTLAAIAAPPEKIDQIAEIVNQFEQVNHNYAREHDYNLWFVVTASDPMALAETLEEIELLTGLPILVLPMEASYHIDLGFKINFSKHGKMQEQKTVNKIIEKAIKLASTETDNKVCLSQDQQALLRGIIEKGLPIQPRPFAEIAEQVGVSSSQVIQQILHWQNGGLIRRFGLVVKHRKLGYNANAMVVWNIPNEFVDAIAGQLSKFDEVSLCYRRPRRSPDWHYNLFCMIHGTDRNFVLAQIAKITQQVLDENSHIWSSANDLQQDILFSTKAYKQHGARYSKANNTTQKKTGTVKRVSTEKDSVHG
jgi:DNA-binding Lrp family transcriptional regulator